VTLQEKARHVLAARDSGDPRYLELVVKLALRMQWAPAQVQAEIERLAA
jgi:hypothetical protein